MNPGFKKINFILLFVLIVTTKTFSTPGFRATVIDTGINVRINAISDSGHIAGFYQLYEGNPLGFFIYNNTFIEVGGFGGEQTRATCINDNGLVVGFSEIESGENRPFYFENDSIFEIRPIEAQAFHVNVQGQILVNQRYGDGYIFKDGLIEFLPEDFEPVSINDLGQVVGVFNSKAAIFTNDSIISLNMPERYNQSRGMDINNAGQVVGWASSTLGIRPFLFSNGTFNDLGLPDSVSGNAWSINNQGQVVGQYHNGKMNRGFLFENETFFDLNDLIEPLEERHISEAKDINNKGQIVATAIGNTASTHTVGLILTRDSSLVSLNRNKIEKRVREREDGLYDVTGRKLIKHPMLKNPLIFLEMDPVDVYI